MNKKLRVLILEDRPPDAELMVRELLRAGYEPEWERVETESDYLAKLDKGWQIILADFTMPQFSGLRALGLLKERGLDIPFIIVSGSIGEDTAVAAMKAGVHDYVMKDNLARLAPAVKRELHDATVRLQRRQAEEALEESEEHYRVLTESISDAIIVIDQDSRIIRFANSSIERILGYSPNELVGKELTVLMPERFRGEHRAGVKRYIETGLKNFDWQARGVLGLHKTGKEVPLEASYGEFTKGGTRCFIGVLRDITEAKRTDEALKLFRTLVDRTNDIIEVVDAQTGRFLDVNERGCLELGYTRDEFLALSIFDVDPSVNQAEFTNAIEGLRKSEGLTRDGMHRRKDNSTFPVEVNMRYARLERDYVVTVVRDITERKAGEEVRLRRQEELEQFFRLSVGRELQMIDLKKEVNELAESLGRTPAYDLSNLEEQEGSAALDRNEDAQF